MAKIQIMTASVQQAGQLCSICQTGLVSGEEMVYCPDCGLPFHLECWQENQGCSAYGCDSAPQTSKNETVSAADQAWDQDKICPACGQKIKAQAIKCHHCGVNFETRMAISRKEYDEREYSGQEYYLARNKIAGLFLAAASGCLSPVALVILALIVLDGAGFGLEYKRLPGALRGMAISGLCIGSFLMLLFFVLIIFD